MKTTLVFLLLFAAPAFAQSKKCQSMYNPHTARWEYVCVERERGGCGAERAASNCDYRPPVCRQEYDPMNRRWVTVCE